MPKESKLTGPQSWPIWRFFTMRAIPARTATSNIKWDWDQRVQRHMLVGRFVMANKKMSGRPGSWLENPDRPGLLAKVASMGRLQGCKNASEPCCWTRDGQSSWTPDSRCSKVPSALMWTEADQVKEPHLRRLTHVTETKNNTSKKEINKKIV